MVAGLNGTIYAIGGNDIVCNGFANVEAYDVNTNAWTSVAPLPQPQSNHAVVALAPDGRIYSAGGEIGSNACQVPGASLFIYDPSVDSWTSGTDMPTGVIAAGPFGTGQNSLLYVFGGIAAGEVLASVHCSGATPTALIGPCP